MDLDISVPAMLKVEDGCVNFCSYCIIPYARGPIRSLPLETAVERTQELERTGYREIVLTGIEISSWGADLKTGQSLIDLMEALSAAAPGLRLRLGSLEPRTITEDFCLRAAKLSNLCPQFHLSMEGTTTTFELRGPRVLLTRSGKVNSQMVFEEGRQHTSLYETPMGQPAIW